jgi:periplasmic protein CpxP/Spy
MDIFSQKKVLIRLVAILVLLNICSVGFVFWKSTGNPQLAHTNQDDYHDVSGVLVKELGLNEKQAGQIKDIRDGIYAKELTLGEVLKGERDSMNEEMFNNNTNDEHLKTLAKSVSENEYKMELLRIEQAQQLKAICTPQQLEKLNSLVIEIRDYFRPDNRPNCKPPERR